MIEEVLKPMLWIEKYRPKYLDDIIGQKHVVEQLKSFIKAGNFPNLILYGPPGT